MSASGIERWQPPEGFVAVPSQVPGITVHAPAPPPDADLELVTVGRCDRCGGTTRYEAATGKLRCEHCSTRSAVTAGVAGRSAPEREFRRRTLDRLARGWGVERRLVHCEGCGADVVLDARAVATSCAFCASRRVVARRAPQDVLRPTHLLPFQLDRQRCAELVREWAGTSWMAPRALREIVRTARFEAVYLPAWTFNALVTARWTVLVGRKVSTSDGSEIRWTRRSGNTAALMNDELGSAVRDVPDRLFARIGPFDLSQLVGYGPGYLAGWTARSATVALEPAWTRARLAWRDRPRKAAWDELRKRHRHLRDFNATVDFMEETWRHVLVPVFVGAFRHRNRTYQVLVNGQTGRVAAQMPADWMKVGAALGGVLAPSALLAGASALVPSSEWAAGLLDAARLTFVASWFAGGWLVHRVRKQLDA